MKNNHKEDLRSDHQLKILSFLCRTTGEDGEKEEEEKKASPGSIQEGMFWSLGRNSVCWEEKTRGAGRAVLCPQTPLCFHRVGPSPHPLLPTLGWRSDGGGGGTSQRRKKEKEEKTGKKWEERAEGRRIPPPRAHDLTQKHSKEVELNLRRKSKTTSSTSTLRPFFPTSAFSRLLER